MTAPTHDQQARADAKRLATATARAALRGIVVHVIDGDFLPQRYIATRWALSKEFKRIEDLESWLDLVTGAKPVAE